MATVFMYQALSRSSRTLNVLDMTLHDYSSEYHCFDLLWLGLTKWKETLKVVSWLPPISCYCAISHSSVQLCLSLSEVDCFWALWYETLHPSPNVFHTSKKCLYFAKTSMLVMPFSGYFIFIMCISKVLGTKQTLHWKWFLMFIVVLSAPVHHEQ